MVMADRPAAVLVSTESNRRLAANVASGQGAHLLDPEDLGPAPLYQKLPLGATKSLVGNISCL